MRTRTTSPSCTNATTGVNTVLRSLRFAPGDELLTTDHEYNASRNALDFVARHWGAKVVVAKLPWPVTSSQAVVDAVLAHVTARTRLLLIDHITSQTALVLPVAELIRALRERGVETLVDGAHGPGHAAPVPAHAGRRATTRATATSGCARPRALPSSTCAGTCSRASARSSSATATTRGAGTAPSSASTSTGPGRETPRPFLCVPKALEVVGGMLPGGWPEVMASNRAKALTARAFLCERLGVAPHCPEEMVGSMATVALPDGFPAEPSALGLDPLQDRLLFEHGIEVPITPWPRPPHRHVRVSAQLYNSHAEYQRLAEALDALLR